jgi:hypothetical protein
VLISRRIRRKGRLEEKTNANDAAGITEVLDRLEELGVA